MSLIKKLVLFILLLIPVISSLFMQSQSVVKEVCGDCGWYCMRGHTLTKVPVYVKNCRDIDGEAGSPEWTNCQCPEVKAFLEKGYSIDDLTFADGGSIIVKTDQDKAAEKKLEVAGSYRMSCKNCSLNYVEGWLAAGYALSCECWDKNSKSWKKALMGLDINKKVFNCESNQIRNNNGNLECCPMGICEAIEDEERITFKCVRCE